MYLNTKAYLSFIGISSFIALFAGEAVNADRYFSDYGKITNLNTINKPFNTIAEINSFNESQLDIKSQSATIDRFKCDPFINPRSISCLGASTDKSLLPQNNFEKLLQDAAIYSEKIVPLLNAKSDSSIYTNTLINDGKEFFMSKATNLAASYANEKIQEIPFFAQTSLGFNTGGSGKGITLSIDSLMKLKEIDKDQDGDIKTLLFAQSRVAVNTESAGTTNNYGLGIRHRPNTKSMIGANAFFDYRTTTYSSSHSRFGLGAEYLWKDFELRNNYYIPITGAKSVTIGDTDWKERVVPGWDVEVGYRLPNNPEIAFFVKGFNWDYKDTQDNSGLAASINYQATPRLSIEAWLSNEISAHETIANTALPALDETFFGVNIKLTRQPVFFKKNRFKENMVTQMTQPVRRRYEVLLERSNGWSNRAKGS